MKAHVPNDWPEESHKPAFWIFHVIPNLARIKKISMKKKIISTDILSSSLKSWLRIAHFLRKRTFVRHTVVLESDRSVKIRKNTASE